MTEAHLLDEEGVGLADPFCPVLLPPVIGLARARLMMLTGRRIDAETARDWGLILDVVPNHMGIGKVLNAWWRDVLENGPSSRYADAFDIDWHPIKRELESKVLLPILGDQYGTVLENQEIQIQFVDGAFLGQRIGFLRG